MHWAVVWGGPILMVAVASWLVRRVDVHLGNPVASRETVGVQTAEVFA